MTKDQYYLFNKICDSIFFRPPYVSHMTAGLVVKLCVIADPDCRAFDALAVADYCKEMGLCKD